MRKKLCLFALALLTSALATAQSTWFLEGEGTESSPYLISSTADWQTFARLVNTMGNNYEGKYIRMTADIDANGLSVGGTMDDTNTIMRAFSGTFDGDGHTLTYNRGESTSQDVTFSEDACAPFIRLEGATIRHLYVTGSIYSNHMHAAGIASQIDGSEVTTIMDCHVSSLLSAGESISNDASFAGLVGNVNETCTADSILIKDCSFTGSIIGYARRSSGLVGYTNRPVTFENCFFDPKMTPFSDECATFVRMASGVACTFSECYYTAVMGTVQGRGIFTKVEVPTGCTAEIISEPFMTRGGKKYYVSGAQVRLTVPEGTQFDHWAENSGCFVSDPWTAGGVHTFSDVKGTPDLSIATAMPTTVKDGTDRNGFYYRYLSDRDYRLYMSDSLRQERNYQFDDDGSLYVYDAKGNWTWITVVTHCDPTAETFQNYIREGWFWNEKNYEGSIIVNDMSATFYSHSHLFAIAPRAFQGVKDLKRLVFLSNVNDDEVPIGLDVAIQEQAFKDSGIEELVMMYRDGDADKWIVLNPDDITIAPNAFEGTDARICVDPSVYQKFLSSEKWTAHQNRISIYAAKIANIKQDGAIYSYWADSQTNPVKNNAEGHTTLMQTLRTWNASYMNFNAADLLAEQDNKNIWYLQVTGVDNSSLVDSIMIIRNDPGTYYNYKTLNIAANAFKDNKNLKVIEFQQVKGDRDHYADLKMVIQNGAFKGCSNLKELRMFCYDTSTSNDHWESLGPQDVIPGNNIFGLDRLTDDQKARLANGEDVISELNPSGVPSDFRILVAPERMAEFMQDPNWAPYLQYIEAADLTQTSASDEFTIDGSDGLTYAYITNMGGIRETSQTVSQDLSWWTLPRIVVEVAMHVATIGVTLAASESASYAATGQAAKELATVTSNQTTINTISTATGKAIGEVVQEADGKFAYNWMTSHAVSIFRLVGGKQFDKVPYFSTFLSDEVKQGLVNQGWMNAEYVFTKQIWGLSHEQVYQGLLLIRDPIQKAVGQAAADVTAATLKYNSAYNAYRAAFNSIVNAQTVQGMSAMTVASGLVAKAVWDSNYNNESLKKGMRDNILSNIHEFSLQGGSYIIMTPTKNLVYHSYVKRVSDDTKDAVIYAGTDDDQGMNASSVTMTFAYDAFRNHKNLKTVKFHENNISTNEGVPMLLTIPDSAFYGCDNLVEFSTILQSDNGDQVLGPESFILGGDSVFVGLDSLKFHILIDESRKEDYLASESWAPLKRYFQYTNVKPKRKYDEYGGWYAYAYENGSLQKIHKVQGHTIEHMVVSEPDDSFLKDHQGALKLCNDIGVFNNYQLDAVRYKAFYGNQNLRVVNFTDLKGSGATGDTYTGLEVTLEDSCFARCPNLANIDMLYLVTDGTNRIDPITPQQVKLGRGVLDGTTASIKMMPKQVEWFQKDTTWAKYADRFLPCIIKVADEEVADVLEDMAYYDMAHTGYDDVLWTDYIDFARIAGTNFTCLNGKFQGNTDIRSFNEFRQFDCVGLDFVGSEWFSGCSNLGSIALPATITSIEVNAFKDCSSLTAIELPASLTSIADGAFTGCTGLTSVRVLARTPATLDGDNIFDKHDGLKIYVPDGAVDAYKQAWAEYRDYIFSDKTMTNRKVVTVTEVGQLAQELGLTLEKENDKIRYIRGEYASIDSLTITGPLNGEDLGLIRHLSGADAYDSDPTDGCLVYLNLWNADLKEDDENSYNGNGIDEYIDADNKVPDYLFENCTSIQTVIFPKTATYIGENIFEDATGLRKLCVGKATTEYECDILQSLEGIEELVLLTDAHATSDYKDPWEANIGATFTTNAQVGNYLGDINLTRRTNYVVAPFEDDAVMLTLADKGLFFPSEYSGLENVDGLFNDNSTITDFSDFYKFSKVKELNTTFTNASALCTVTLPESITTISAEAFAGCTSLDTIRIACDSVPAMAAGALDDLPGSFRIFVPKRLCKLYRTKWAEYADHINVDESRYDDSDIITVTLTEPNTLAQKLGLSYSMGGSYANDCIRDLRGDYSEIYKLKVVGPISGGDFDVIRHLAGWCPCIQRRNLAGHLQYLDLYEADIRASAIGINGENSGMSGSSSHVYSVSENDVMPYHALLKAYNLKTLILPKSCKEVAERSLQECEGLEVIVIGDKTEEFNWNALDDDASLARMYFLTEKKVEITSQNALWRALCNNYNPTFDAFYVRPSQLETYRSDANYTSSSWQRTNNIQCGIFTDDDQFLPFAAHAAVTYDDLATVTDVNGWFSGQKDLKDLSALTYTSIPSLRIGDLHELTKLEKIALPMTFEAFYDNTIQYDTLGNVIPDELDHRPFVNAKNLRYIDMMVCDSTMVIDDLRGNIKQKLGVCDNALVYVPSTYGSTDEHNVIWGDSTSLQNNYFDLCDTLDYYVPYGFTSRHISNQRVLKAKKADDGTTDMEESKYTVCLPYSMPVPANAKAFRLASRNGSSLVFNEEMNTMEAGTPYVIVLTNSDVSLNSDVEQALPTTTQADADLFSHQVDVNGYSMRGSLKAIDNATASELGAYILQADNKWHLVPSGVEDAYIPAFRAYLLQNSGAAGIRAFSMEFEGGVTGVDSIVTVDSDGNETYYDLSGRKLGNQQQRGIYIHSGKKYVNK